MIYENASQLLHSVGWDIGWVLTNGCFDVLHAGHVAYLEEASLLGTGLVVGVNRDETVRFLKGEMRPIHTLKERMYVLSALRFVTHVVAFAEHTPTALIQTLKPALFVKGGDYRIEDLPEKEAVIQGGGAIHLIDIRYKHCSSTRAIQMLNQEKDLKRKSETS